MPKKIKLLMGCYYDSVDNNLPKGFQWINDLLLLFPSKYDITMLLYGDCYKYGLTDATYKSRYDEPNPFISLLTTLGCAGVKIVVCNYIIEQNGLNKNQLLPFVCPVKFSIDYIATSIKKGSIVVYDAIDKKVKNELSARDESTEV